MIGRRVYNTRNICSNSVYKCSAFCTYRFGNSNSFSIFNIKMMQKFYCTFPIFNLKLNELTWDHYIELLKINDLSERYFYFGIALFCRSNISDLKLIIGNDIYNYI